LIVDTHCHLHDPAFADIRETLSRAVTHDAALSGCEAEFSAFVASLDPLGEKRGPLLLQLPAEFRRTDDAHRKLSTFLGRAPSGVKLAVEFRDVSWHGDGTYELLREKGAALAWTAWRELPPHRGSKFRGARYRP